MTNNGSVNNYVSEQPVEEPVNDGMALDTSDFDIFSQLDDVVIEDASEEVEVEEVETGDEDDITGYTPDEDATDLYDEDELEEVEAEEAANGFNWDSMADDHEIFEGVTKSFAQEAIQSKEDFEAYNNEYSEYRGAVDQKLEELADIQRNSMSYLDLALQTQYGKLQNAVTDVDIASATRQIKMLEQEKAKVAAHSKKAQEGVDFIKAQNKAKAINNFKRDARKEYGANWEQKIMEIADGVPVKVQQIVGENPSIEMINFIRDAKAFRAGKAANKNAVKNAGKKAKANARSVKSNSKGAAPTTSNKAKLVKKMQAGYATDSDVFAALED
ncbi:hypothetical protein AB4259_02695 [Vibrio amylolyticus]|uniref:hypothetical protein n=1 Tax=Vibrio amylolyticus TaxID=2847292 RepID=UPI0035521784